MDRVGDLNKDVGFKVRGKCSYCIIFLESTIQKHKAKIIVCDDKELGAIGELQICFSSAIASIYT